MKRPTGIVLAAAFAASLLAAGCYYDKEELLYPKLAAGCDTTNVTFQRTIAPLLAARCAGCHSDANAGAFGGGVRLETYAEVVASIGRLHGAVTWTPGFSAMPKDGARLDDCSIRSIEIWMDRGTPEAVAAAGGTAR